MFNDEFQRLWLATSRMLLNVAFTQVSSLEALLLWRDDNADEELSLPLSLSALEVGALAWPSWTTSLQKLRLSLAIDQPGCAFEFGMSDHLTAQTLVLSDITAQFTQLAPLLESSLHPLRRFELSRSHVSEYADFKQLLDFLLCMSELQSCTLDRSNFAQNSLRLGKLNELRPTTVDEAHWVMVYWHRYSRIQCQSQIAIHADEGDDNRYWLRQTMQHATFGRPWLL